MLLLNCAEELQTALDQTSPGGVDLVAGENLFIDQFTPQPYGNTVVLLNTGGLEPQPYLSVANQAPAAYQRARVQILVYGDPNDTGFSAGEALARAILGQLAFATHGSFVAVRAVESQPTYVGPEPETGRHVFSMNLQCEYKATTAGN